MVAAGARFGRIALEPLDMGDEPAFPPADRGGRLYRSPSRGGRRDCGYHGDGGRSSRRFLFGRGLGSRRLGLPQGNLGDVLGRLRFLLGEWRLLTLRFGRARRKFGRRGGESCGRLRKLDHYNRGAGVETGIRKCVMQQRQCGRTVRGDDHGKTDSPAQGGAARAFEGCGERCHRRPATRATKATSRYSPARSTFMMPIIWPWATASSVCKRAHWMTPGTVSSGAPPSSPPAYT